MIRDDEEHLQFSDDETFITVPTPSQNGTLSNIDKRKHADNTLQYETNKELHGVYDIKSESTEEIKNKSQNNMNLQLDKNERRQSLSESHELIDANNSAQQSLENTTNTKRDSQTPLSLTVSATDTQLQMIDDNKPKTNVILIQNTKPDSKNTDSGTRSSSELSTIITSDDIKRSIRECKMQDQTEVTNSEASISEYSGESSTNGHLNEIESKIRDERIEMKANTRSPDNENRIINDNSNEKDTSDYGFSFDEIVAIQSAQHGVIIQTCPMVHTGKENNIQNLVNVQINNQGNSNGRIDDKSKEATSEVMNPTSEMRQEPSVIYSNVEPTEIIKKDTSNLERMHNEDFANTVNKDDTHDLKVNNVSITSEQYSNNENETDSPSVVEHSPELNNERNSTRSDMYIKDLTNDKKMSINSNIKPIALQRAVDTESEHSVYGHTSLINDSSISSHVINSINSESNYSYTESYSEFESTPMDTDEEWEELSVDNEVLDKLIQYDIEDKKHLQIEFVERKTGNESEIRLNIISASPGLNEDINNEDSKTEDTVNKDLPKEDNNNISKSKITNSDGNDSKTNEPLTFTTEVTSSAELSELDKNKEESASHSMTSTKNKQLNYPIQAQTKKDSNGIEYENDFEDDRNMQSSKSSKVDLSIKRINNASRNIIENDNSSRDMNGSERSTGMSSMVSPNGYQDRFSNHDSLDSLNNYDDDFESSLDENKLSNLNSSEEVENMKYNEASNITDTLQNTVNCSDTNENKRDHRMNSSNVNRSLNLHSAKYSVATPSNISIRENKEYTEANENVQNTITANNFETAKDNDKVKTDTKQLNKKNVSLSSNKEPHTHTYRKGNFKRKSVQPSTSKEIDLNTLQNTKAKKITPKRSTTSEKVKISKQNLTPVRGSYRKYDDTQSIYSSDQLLPDINITPKSPIYNNKGNKFTYSRTETGKDEHVYNEKNGTESNTSKRMRIHDVQSFVKRRSHRQYRKQQKMDKKSEQVSLNITGKEMSIKSSERGLLSNHQQPRDAVQPIRPFSGESLLSKRGKLTNGLQQDRISIKSTSSKESLKNSRSKVTLDSRYTEITKLYEAKPEFNNKRTQISVSDKDKPHKLKKIKSRQSRNETILSESQSYKNGKDEHRFKSNYPDQNAIEMEDNEDSIHNNEENGGRNLNEIKRHSTEVVYITDAVTYNEDEQFIRQHNSHSNQLSKDNDSDIQRKGHDTKEHVTYKTVDSELNISVSSKNDFLRCCKQTDVVVSGTSSQTSVDVVPERKMNGSDHEFRTKTVDLKQSVDDEDTEYIEKMQHRPRKPRNINDLNREIIAIHKRSLTSVASSDQLTVPQDYLDTCGNTRQRDDIHTVKERLNEEHTLINNTDADRFNQLNIDNKLEKENNKIRNNTIDEHPATSENSKEDNSTSSSSIVNIKPKTNRQITVDSEHSDNSYVVNSTGHWQVVNTFNRQENQLNNHLHHMDTERKQSISDTESPEIQSMKISNLIRNQSRTVTDHDAEMDTQEKLIIDKQYTIGNNASEDLSLAGNLTGNCNINMSQVSDFSTSKSSNKMEDERLYLHKDDEKCTSIDSRGDKSTNSITSQTKQLKHLRKQQTAQCLYDKNTSVSLAKPGSDRHEENTVSLDKTSKNYCEKDIDNDVINVAVEHSLTNSSTDEDNMSGKLRRSNTVLTDIARLRDIRRELHLQENGDSSDLRKTILNREDVKLIVNDIIDDIINAVCRSQSSHSNTSDKIKIRRCTTKDDDGNDVLCCLLQSSSPDTQLSCFTCTAVDALDVIPVTRRHERLISHVVKFSSEDGVVNVSSGTLTAQIPIAHYYVEQWQEVVVKTMSKSGQWPDTGQTADIVKIDGGDKVVYGVQVDVTQLTCVVVVTRPKVTMVTFEQRDIVVPAVNNPDVKMKMFASYDLENTSKHVKLQVVPVDLARLVEYRTHQRTDNEGIMTASSPLIIVHVASHIPESLSFTVPYVALSETDCQMINKLVGQKSHDKSTLISRGRHVPCTSLQPGILAPPLSRSLTDTFRKIKGDKTERHLVQICDDSEIRIKLLENAERDVTTPDDVSHMKFSIYDKSVSLLAVETKGAMQYSDVQNLVTSFIDSIVMHRVKLRIMQDARNVHSIIISATVDLPYKQGYQGYSTEVQGQQSDLPNMAHNLKEIDLQLYEGDVIAILFRGNIDVVNNRQRLFSFHGYRGLKRFFELQVASPYSQRSLKSYNGKLQVFTYKGKRYKPLDKMATPNIKTEWELRLELPLVIPKFLKKTPTIINKAPISLRFQEPLTVDFVRLICVETVKDWNKFATALGISHARIQAIKQHNRNVISDRVLMDVIVCWMKQQPVCNDKVDPLLNALRACDKWTLAAELSQRYRTVTSSRSKTAKDKHLQKAISMVCTSTMVTGRWRQVYVHLARTDGQHSHVINDTKEIDQKYENEASKCYNALCRWKSMAKSPSLWRLVDALRASSCNVAAETIMMQEFNHT